MEIREYGTSPRPSAAPAARNTEHVFTEQFATSSVGEIIEEVRRVGFWMKEGAIATSYVDAMLGEIDFDRYQVNTNAPGPVSTGTQKFLSHCLAASKRAYDIITADRVLEICREYFSGPFKLTNQRMYQTHTEAHMPWHTDNNAQSGNELTGKHQLPGLLFLIYLSDVTENPLQILRHSQDWSKKHTGNYFSDQFINEHYAQDIASFPAMRGTLFVCDIHAVHRAAPFRSASYKRSTLLFQVDGVSPEYPEHGEKLLVNTAFVDRRDPALLDYLGFGAPAAYPTFPATSAATMRLQDLWAMQRALLPMALQSGVKSGLKALIPGALQVNLKRWKWLWRRKPAASTAPQVPYEPS